MNLRFYHKYIFFFYIFLCQQLFAIQHLHRTPQNINDVITFHFNDLKKIQKRYRIDIRKVSFFNQEQKAMINNEELFVLIDLLLLHDDIVLDSTEDLIEYARMIQASEYSLTKLRDRIIRYQERGFESLPALEKAIQQEQKAEWYLRQRDALSDYDALQIRINTLLLAPLDREKVLSVYAKCVNPWRNEEYRNTILAPKICDPLDNYKSPRHKSNPAKVRTKEGTRDTPRNRAYAILVEESAAMAESLNMNAAEKIVMAKCVAEQSLEFFVPSHNPLRTMEKLRAAQKSSPAHTFFSNHGVCTNFSALAYNFGRKMGLQGQLFLAERHLHTYLEINIDGKWYSSHPFNSMNKGCDLIPFEDSGEE